MSKTNKKEKFNIGNYVLLIDRTSDHSWLRIMNIAGTWVLRFRDDDVMMVYLLKMLNNKDYHHILEAQINLMYTTAHNFHDPEFLQDAAKAYSEMNERVIARQPEYNQEESDNALKTALAEHEILEEIKK